MSSEPEIAVVESPRRPDPIVRKIVPSDIVDALAGGIRDFQAAPVIGLVLAAIYVLGGLLMVACATWLGLGYLVYPLAAGFALIGPFVAVGFYEVSRRREAGERATLAGVFAVMRMQGRRELGWMAFVTLFMLIVWLYQVRLLLALFLGFQSFATWGDFLRVVLTTPEGLAFLAVGNLVGTVLSVILFSLTVVSFPLLLDRDVDFVTAMITSVRAVTTSPLPMVGWAIMIAVLLIAAMLPAFLGLFVALPVLGHATWHLYRRVVQ